MLTLIPSKRRGHNRAIPAFLATAALAASAAISTGPAAATTIYDAGQAFLASGHNANSFGPWTLLHASGEALGATSAFDTTAGSSGVYQGIGGSTSPWIRVNTSAATQISSGEEILSGELYLHPAAPSASQPSDVVRFTAPENGWYSAYIFAHDAAREQGNASSDASGVQVTVRAAGNILVRQIVSLEDYAANNPTHRFDFQMPVRWLAAGETIEVVVGNKSGAAHTSDATGLRFTVTKEDEGMFHDSGLAMASNLMERYENPYGNIRDGAWYNLLVAVPNGVDFPVWAATNFTIAAGTRLSAQATRADGLRGFATVAEGTSPYVAINAGTSYSASTAPCELNVHPSSGDKTKWTVVRFRPPRSGYYSASVVARDVNRSTEASHNGVDVYLLVSEKVVTNAYISAETFASTARLTFDSRLLVAGEPVDIAVSPHGQANSDATAVSAIFRREGGEVHDAGASFRAAREAGGTSLPFADALGDGATWNLGYANGLGTDRSFTALGAYKLLSGSPSDWWLHAYALNQNNGSNPRCAMAVDGVASTNTFYVLGNDPLLGTIPNEFVAHTSISGGTSLSPTLRATVPADGIYSVRAYARDLADGGDGAAKDNDGIRLAITVNGYVADFANISRDKGKYENNRYERAVAGDRLWLKADDTFNVTVDAVGGMSNDTTGLHACYEKGDGRIPSVINVDLTDGQDSSGKFSAQSGRGREGWSDWTTWNALRPAGQASAAAANCTEADGTTPRNVTVAISRDSGSAISTAAVSGGSTLHNNYVSSADASDTYTFTISKLQANKPYTLWLYSAKGGATGNATFTVGGATKGVEETWSLGTTKMLTRFDAESDANGSISGTFAAASDDDGAFSGMTIVGDFPEYKSPGFVIVVR